MLVENAGLNPVAVYTQESPTRLATVMPGRSQCVNLRGVETLQRLIADPVGGGRSTVSPRFEVRPGDGWSWTLGTVPSVDALSLVPRAQCDGRT